METDTAQPADLNAKEFSYSPGLIGSFIAGLPKGFILRIGRISGWLAFVLDSRHRRIVRRNLRFVFPEWSDEKIKTVSKNVFKNAFTTSLEIFQIRFSTGEDILKKVRLNEVENYREAVKYSKGVILISAHFGNWEMAGLVPKICFNHPSAFVARELSSKFLDRFLNKARTRFGNMIIDKKGALPKMVRLLHKGWLVGVLIDQGTNRAEGVECTFFGKKVFTTPVAALLARRYDYSVLPGYCARDKDGFLTINFMPPLTLQKTDNAEDDIQINTQMMNDAMEEGIRAYPDQWFWFHKRWKRHYPHLYPEDIERRKRKREKRERKMKNTG